MTRRAAPAIAGLFPADLSEQEFDLFRRLIHRETGITLNDQKRPLVIARLGRHVRRLGFSSYRAYHDFLSDPAVSATERSTFVSAVTTNTTAFFREPYHFDVFRREIATRATSRAGKPLRIWSAACSSGEEPYSIAISLARAVGSLGGLPGRILATDIDAAALERAASGRYARESLGEMPADELRRYFLAEPDGEHLSVHPKLREAVTFQRINLLSDAWSMPYAFDAIFCRNVVIYFDAPSRLRLFARLEASLAEGGLLFLGHAETLLGSGTSLRPCGQTVWRKCGAEERP